jgi:hypothetical protein
MVVVLSIFKSSQQAVTVLNPPTMFLLFLPPTNIYLKLVLLTSIGIVAHYAHALQLSSYEHLVRCQLPLYDCTT